MAIVDGGQTIITLSNHPLRNRNFQTNKQQQRQQPQYIKYKEVPRKNWLRYIDHDK